MSAQLAALVPPATAVVSGWFIFWMQLPRLVTSSAAAVVAVVALLRARREDIPKVFSALRNSTDRLQYRQTRMDVRPAANRLAALSVRKMQVADEIGQPK
ncbi:hypothetical protein [Nocardia jiangxiensis]|uniref:hypothetical protein n=1 Tax=Nocardia jiangxiensis TaxID=282685 RepID=UPI0012F6BC75|nr:hypothetical protein [Nocardia jiangxiensis]